MTLSTLHTVKQNHHRFSSRRSTPFIAFCLIELGMHSLHLIIVSDLLTIHFCC